MLIRIARLDEPDLAHWEAMERVDAVRARHASFRRRCDEALTSLVQFASGREYAGVSWGKDSTVLAHLCALAQRQFGIVIPLVWVKIRPIFNPHCELVRDAFLRAHDVDYHEIAVDCSRDAGGWHASGTLERGFAGAVSRFGHRHISGVRGEESATRKLRMMRWGAETTNTLAPLIRWSAEDVFAYLHAHDLPVHPAYAMTLGGVLDRLRLRVSSLGGQRGTGHGRLEWESRYYANEVAMLEAEDA